MFVYGACVADDARFAVAQRSIRAHAGADAVIERRSSRVGIAGPYNELIDRALELDAEALVLLHEDVEILDARLEDVVRRTLAEHPDTAVMGVIGASGVTSIRWWRGQKAGRVFESRGINAGPRADGVVDSLDGLLLILSPLAMRRLRFDESVPGFHAYDFDICAQARRAGLEVRVIAVDVAHHAKGGYGHLATFRAADARMREKWSLPRQRTLLAHDVFNHTANKVAKVILPSRRPQRPR